MPPLVADHIMAAGPAFAAVDLGAVADHGNVNKLIWMLRPVA